MYGERLIDWAAERRAERAQRFEELMDQLRQAPKEREFFVGDVVRPTSGSIYIAWISEKSVIQDASIETEWLASCPKYRRHNKSFIPDRRARLWRLDEETSKVEEEISAGKLFFRSFERADFILRGFELLYVATGVIRQTKIGDEDGEPGQLILKYDKKLVGAAVFQSMNIIDFSRTKEESSRLKEQSAFDTTSVYRLQKALGIGTWDWRDDPRGMSPEG